MITTGDLLRVISSHSVRCVDYAKLSIAMDECGVAPKQRGEINAYLTSVDCELVLERLGVSVLDEPHRKRK